ncbi:MULTISPECIES: alpha-L-fucosidase [unclassified Oceanispirochaeta]|uniref:alpha-L-fucosidase n=1 Tax=unclassified Oceanispirochaeta TaxID=2635722 RepID=UPI000E08DCCE|nr:MULTISPECIES: alpha-L-fucosidase [unclassified Oceanispirochaeta]MBF9016542.1 alpha-L-fucosidase [Oceanispirochaeta sp. M2]NPD73004.1 alpha-L-fucosidase [Oceanispirochaeta sp. M1]RDG31348.1 alpha-L-fucosidase [Oceanispirochaeta sp. M1]
MNDKQRRIRKFSDLGFGLVLHWGLYSLYERGEWVQYAHNLDIASYKKRISDFNAAGFDPQSIASLARKNGAGFIILTTRHHDGFSLYDTNGLNDFDAPHSSANRDLIKEFVSACNDEGILPILYHTTLDWQWNGKTTMELDNTEFDNYLDYLYESVEILCSNYGQVGGFIFDGNWSRPDMDCKYDRLYGMIRKHQPDAIIMDNTGLERPGVRDHHEIDAVTFEQHAICEENITYGDNIAALRWLTFNDHWSWSCRDFNFKSGKEIIEGLVQSRRFGAVYTLNMGPLADGSLEEMDLALINKIGRWMEIYGDAIRKGRPMNYSCSGKDFLLEDANACRGYYFCHELGIAGLDNVTRNKKDISVRKIFKWDRPVHSLHWMDNNEKLKWEDEEDCLAINCTGFPYGENHVVRVAIIEWYLL